MGNAGNQATYFPGAALGAAATQSQFNFRDAAGANGGAANSQLVREYLAYYQGQEQVLKISPDTATNKDYTWAFVNYKMSNTASVTANISMKMWVSGTGTALVVWDGSTDGTRPQFINQTIQAGQWVQLNGTAQTFTPKSDSKLIGLDPGGLVGRTIYITDVVVTGVTPALNSVVNE
jgi:hypothetical protein